MDVLSSDVVTGKSFTRCDGTVSVGTFSPDYPAAANVLSTDTVAYVVISTENCEMERVEVYVRWTM